MRRLPIPRDCRRTVRSTLRQSRTTEATINAYRQSPAKIDYFAIAAYTVQPADGAGHYRLVNTSLHGGNGLEVIVHLGGRAPLFAGKVARDAPPPAGFDTNIGFLAPGDTVYVGVGPDQDDGSDSFRDFDFTIARASGPLLPSGNKSVVLKEGFENPVTGWLARGQAQFGRSADQPHAGSHTYQIVVAPGVPLTYPQIQRVVEENPLPGDRYHLTAWVRTRDVSADTGAYGYLEFVGESDQRLGLHHTPVQVKNGARGWEALSAQGAVPPGTRRVRVGLVLQAAGTAWFDVVEVSRETGPSP